MDNLFPLRLKSCSNRDSCFTIARLSVYIIGLGMLLLHVHCADMWSRGMGKKKLVPKQKQGEREGKGEPAQARNLVRAQQLSTKRIFIYYIFTLSSSRQNSCLKSAYNTNHTVKQYRKQ